MKNNVNMFAHPVIAFKKAIHPTLAKLMPGMRDFDLNFINEKPEVDGPVLYIINHTNMHDAPIACEAIKDHFYVLIAKQKLSFINRVFFALNGNITVDRDNRKSGLKSTNKMIKLLNSGSNVVMFSEGTWCIKPSYPINHLHWGWVNIAKETNATVIPIAIEYYELTDNCCYINFGEPFKVDKDSIQKDTNDKMEEILVTLKEEIWRQFPIQKRSEIPDKLWSAIVTWRYYEMGESKQSMEHEKKYVVGHSDYPEEVLETPEFKNSILKLNRVKK